MTWSVVRRGFLVCLAFVLLISLALPPSVVRGGGLGAGCMTIYDEVLSALGLADGSPCPQRVNESGALWTVDSDLADSIVTGSEDMPGGAEYALVLPKGTRAFKVKLKSSGAGYPTATDYVMCGGVSGTRNWKIKDGRPLEVEDFDSPTLGTTLWCQPQGGRLIVQWFCIVSQNPD